MPDETCQACKAPLTQRVVKRRKEMRDWPLCSECFFNTPVDYQSPCQIWTGDIDLDTLEPVNNAGQPVRPGLRACGYRDCVNVHHVLGYTTRKASRKNPQQKMLRPNYEAERTKKLSAPKYYQPEEIRTPSRATIYRWRKMFGDLPYDELLQAAESIRRNKSKGYTCQHPSGCFMPAKTKNLCNRHYLKLFRNKKEKN